MVVICLSDASLSQTMEDYFWEMSNGTRAVTYLQVGRAGSGSPCGYIDPGLCITDIIHNHVRLLEREHELISQLFWRNVLILRLGRSGKWFFDVLCNVPQPFICYHDVKNGNVPPRQFTSKTLQDQINIFPIQWVLLFFSHKMLSVLANAYSYMYECCLMVYHFFMKKKIIVFFNNKNTGILARVLFIVTPLKPIGEHFCK